MAHRTWMLTGNLARPEVVLAFPGSDTRTLAWVRTLPARTFDRQTRRWHVAAFGCQPSAALTRAGFTVTPADAHLVDSLYWPLALHDPTAAAPTHASVAPRFAGYERTAEILGPAAEWRRQEQSFTIDLAELAGVDGPRPGITAASPSLWEAVTARRHSLTASQRSIDAQTRQLHHALHSSTGREEHLAAHRRRLTEATGGVPEWFGLDLYDYQRVGAMLVAQGRHLLADAPGIGKCVTADTLIDTVNPDTAETEQTPIHRLWDRYRHAAVPIDGGFEAPVTCGLTVRTWHPQQGMTLAPVTHVWRQWVSETLHRITTDTGQTVTATARHRFLTPNGWKASPRPGDTIALADGETLRWVRVTDQTPIDHTGWVYDLTVDGTHAYLAEQLVTHNTRSSLAAAAILQSERTLIVAPPALLTSWESEAQRSRLPTLGADIDDTEHLTVIRPGRKEPASLPPSGVVIVSDSMLQARPALCERVRDWDPTLLIYDEAQRARTWTSARSEMMRSLAEHIHGPRVCLSGTPFYNSAAELPGILAITGDLAGVFGGYGVFMEEYCFKNRFNAWISKKHKRAQLKSALDAHVWVRRVKSEVLPDLPPKQRSARWVDVKLADYNAAHRELADKLDAWVASHRSQTGQLPTDSECADYAQTRGIGLMSPLRKAAGMAKIPIVCEQMADWVASEPDRPLVIWVHHHEVTAALADAARKVAARTSTSVAVIDGATGQKARDEAVAGFQAGKISVLICSITAAGVGLTLTRGSDVWFVESDFTPALIVQAEDRCQRIGQQNTVTVLTFLAEGTLDERIQAILTKKSRELEDILTGADNAPQVLDASLEDTSPLDLVTDLVYAARDRVREVAA